MIEVTIERLGLHGDGIADGPLYVPMTLPGEKVSGVVEGKTLGNVRIETPSSQRVSPPCRHFKSCGGCQLQHASDEFVADWKREIVRNALRSHRIETDVRPVLTSPPLSRRRAAFAARRTKKGATAGFFARGSDVIVDIPDCNLLDPHVLRGRRVAEILALHGASRKSTLTVQVTASLAGLDVRVAGGKPLDGPLQQKLARLCAELKVARLCWEDDVVVMLAAPVQQFGRAAVTPPPGAFLQATRHGEADLLNTVREIMPHGGRIADLFAGSGTFSLPLAETHEIYAVEGERQMLAALDLGWRNTAGLKPVTTEPRDLFRRPLLAEELNNFDAVVLDPPRAGSEAQVAELGKSKVPCIAYVSCNPVSFARDVAQLVQNGFSLNWVQPVDQFRWSSHLELVGSLTRD